MQDTRATLTEQFMEDVAQHQVAYSRMAVGNLLNPAKEDDVIEIITTGSQLDFIIGNSVGTEGDTGDDDDDEVYTKAEELKAFSIATAVRERQKRMKTEEQSIIRASQREVRLDKQGTMRHTSILDDFKSQ